MPLTDSLNDFLWSLRFPWPLIQVSAQLNSAGLTSSDVTLMRRTTTTNSGRSYSHKSNDSMSQSANGRGNSTVS